MREWRGRKLVTSTRRRRDAEEKKQGQNLRAWRKRSPAMEYSVVQKVGCEISAKDVESCVVVIREGCAVNPKSAAQELPRSVSVVILYADGDIVGVRAKIGRASCRERV